MTQTTENTSSVYSQLAVLLIIALAVSIAVFFGFSKIGDEIVSWNWKNINSIEEDHIKDLQDYIAENNINADDTEALNKWRQEQSERRGIIVFDIYRGDTKIYTSNYTEDTQTKTRSVYYDSQKRYSVEFADGTADVCISDIFAYSFPLYSQAVALLAGFIAFFTVFMAGIQTHLKYILLLRNEVKILEGGNLDYPITISGANEFTELAGSLENMRKSFANQIKREEQLREENKALTAEISHDIRTPLTVLLIYTEALRQKKYSDEEQFEQYLKRIDEKAHQIKELADSVFDYSRKKHYEAIRKSENDTLQSAFSDRLSEMAEYIKESGGNVETRLEWEKKNSKIIFNPDYIRRITDNILSNIGKYGDPNKPTKIYTVYKDNFVGIGFSNKILKESTSSESTKIGIKNIRNMMQEMDGYCTTEVFEDIFEITVMFKNIAE